MDNLQTTNDEIKTSWLDRPIFSSPLLTIEKLIFVLILMLAIFTRFNMLEPRVMSHDETSHTYFSWLFYKGLGYAHDPVTHGPLQFHLVALSYFIFGDSDTTARIPAAIFSVASVAFMWYYRRYFGRIGALIAAFLLTISPFMLYYGRYVRNEAFVAFFGILMLWSILRYIDTGKSKYLYLFTAVTVLHFCTKETSFIYSAQALLFLAFYLAYRLTKREWKRPEYRSGFTISLAISLVLLASGLLVKYLNSKIAVTNEPLYPFAASIPPYVPIVLIVTGLVGLIGVIYFAISGFGLRHIREERSFDLLMLLGTLVLPQLSAFAINFFGWKVPVNATQVTALTFPDLLRMAAVVVPIFIISILLGIFWNWRKWLINAGIWYAIFIVLYTSMFTNGAGFFTGLVGSLGYWLEQQAVNRGDQPWYYYALIQVPMYEFLPAIGAVIGMVLALLGRRTVHDQALEVELSTPEDVSTQTFITNGESDSEELVQEGDQVQIPEGSPPVPVGAPVIGLLIFWSVTSLIAYTVAGEKMPWLTVHIALPMILLSGWSIGYLVDTVDWTVFRNKKGWLALGLLLVFLPALLSVMRSLLGVNRPFAGRSLDQLAATSEFVIALIVVIACIIGMAFLMKNWAPRMISRGFSLVILVFLAVLTARAAFMASYINYDTAKEYLVYAHCAPGDKIALQQIIDISRRLTGGLDLTVAYDDKTTYPYWWYLRNFPNQRYYGSTPTRDLREVPIILVGQDNFGKIEAVVGEAYDEFDYIRIWWPNMDYFNLTASRIKYALFDPQAREAIFQIWLNRDYKKYGELFGQDMSLQKWSPSEKLRLYIRKDVVAKLWDYGSTASAVPIPVDPYEGKQITIEADKIIGFTGTGSGQFQNPRDIALAPDGTLYVSDTSNNRIQHVTANGTVLQSWGSFADIAKGAASGGTFYEPWGIAVGSDGSVYVADTWNHRIQKFSAEGKFITMWGFFGQAETPFALWGPRDIAIDADGNLLVTDTGNKRVVIYDPKGNYVAQFGATGLEPGQFNEPVGIAVDKEGLVYIVDTWNQRIQVMTKDATGKYIPLVNWDVVAWFGQSLDNKPYIAVDGSGNLYTSDPEGYRVLHFTTQGAFVNFFGDFGIGPNGFNLPSGIITDGNGGVWIADAGNGRIMHFAIPAQ